MTEIFASIGVISVVMVLLGFVFTIGVLIWDFIKQKIYRHKIAHRFDKEPTAKCYCRDCKQWNNNGNRHCREVDRFVEEWGFCWFAEPKKWDEMEARK